MLNCTCAVYSTLNFLGIPFKPAEQHTKMYPAFEKAVPELSVLALMTQEFYIFLLSVAKVIHRHGISKNYIPIRYTNSTS